MAGIGDYIHYKKANYRKFGTYKNDGSNYNDAMRIFQDQREAVRRRLPVNNNQDLEGLENFLNGMMYGKEDATEADVKAMKELQHRVYNAFNERYNNFGINFQKGMNVYYKGDTGATQSEGIYLKTLEKYLQTIKLMADDAIKLKGKADISKINDTIKNLEAYINMNKDQNYISLTNNTAAQSLMKDINEVLKMQSIPKALAIGDAFEYWLAIASQYAGAKAVELSDDLIIDTLVKGGDRSNPIISMSNFSDEYVSMDELIASGAFSPGWKPIDNNTAFRFNKPTQDKLDMVFNWKGDELKVSAKNYKLENSTSTIHLVSGTSLLYLISTENIDFVNHWLNTVTGSPSESIESTRLQQAHIAMKLTIFAKALTGLDTSAQSNVANTFILNHRTNHHIYVRSMREIFDSVEALADKDLKGVNFSNYPIRIPNVWVGAKRGAMSAASAQQRISNLIAKLHTYNISVSMKPEALNKKS